MSKTCNCYLASGEPCRYNQKPDTLYCGIHKLCKNKIKKSPKKASPKKKSPKKKSLKKASPKKKSPKCPPGKEPHPKDSKKCLVSCKPGLVRSMETMRCKKDDKNDDKKDDKNDDKNDDKKGESIALMITGHGSDINEFSKNEKNTFKNVKIAYRIPHNILNFIYPRYFNVLEDRYIKPVKIFSNQTIMNEYIKDCENNQASNKQILLNYEKYIYPGYGSPLASMIKNKKQCYVGHVVMERLFWYGDNTWEKTQNLPKFTKITRPFMGNMFVLRSTQANGNILQGELLSSPKRDGLNELRTEIKNILIKNAMNIRLSQLLPLLQKLYKRVYIYDFTCRSDYTDRLGRKNRQRVYKEEKQPFTPHNSPKK